MQWTLMGLKNILFLIKRQIYFIESGTVFWFACALMRVLRWWRKPLLLVVITFISNGWSNAIQWAKFANQCYKSDLLCLSWTADVPVAYKTEIQHIVQWCVSGYIVSTDSCFLPIFIFSAHQGRICVLCNKDSAFKGMFLLMT